MNPRRPPLRRLLLAFVPAFFAACDGTPTDPGGEPAEQGQQQPVPEANLGFLPGQWSVEAVRVREDGSTVTLAGRSTVSASLNQKALKEVLLVDLGDGNVAEFQALIGQRANSGIWGVSRGDASDGTFDVLFGSLASGAGTFSSWQGSRPDGGQTRLRYTDVYADSFRVSLEQSDDGGSTWRPEWHFRYDRGSTPAPSGTVLNACDNDLHGQFDFWLGDWRAVGASGQGGGTNDIRSRMQGCILEENWAGGASGTSFNMYDVRSELWYQVWIDSNGFLLTLQGGWDGEKMRLTGDAGSIGQRITWTVLEDGRVRQLGEQETPVGGWAQSYDLYYSLLGAPEGR